MAEPVNHQKEANMQAEGRNDEDDPYKLKDYQVDMIPADGGAAPLPKTAEPEAYHDNRIYVSNIPFVFKDEDLVKLFSRFGDVISAMIVCNERGSKGFGFVTMDSVTSCEKAREALHGTRILGRVIEVRKATPLTNKVGPRRGVASSVVSSRASSPRSRITPNNKHAQKRVQQGGTPQIALTKNVVPAPNIGLIQTAQQTVMPVTPLQASALGTLLTDNQALIQNLLASYPIQAIQQMPQTYYTSPLYPGSVPTSFVPIPIAPFQTSFNQQAQSGFHYQVIQPPFDSSYVVGPKGACFVKHDSTGTASLNNTLLSSSMHAHMQGMQDNLVNMLNLDGTINHSILMDFRGDSLLNTSTSSSASDLNDSGRKRRANMNDLAKKYSRC